MINSYFILKDGEEAGPYTLYELMDTGVEVHTMVLSPLADDWQEACDLPEFHQYFENTGLYFPTADNMAGFWWRLLAYIIDYIINILALGAIGALLAVILPILGISGFFTSDDKTMTKLIINLIALLFTISYNSVCEASPMRGSVGKLLLKISVVDVDGRRITFGKAFSRNIGKIASGIVIGIGYFNILWDDHKQAWHDQWAKTYVIRRTLRK